MALQCVFNPCSTSSSNSELPHLFNGASSPESLLSEQHSFGRFTVSMEENHLNSASMHSPINLGLPKIQLGDSSRQLQGYSIYESLSLDGPLPLFEQTTYPVLPSIEAVQNCRKQASSAHAVSMHTDICFYGLELDAGLGNYLIPMFVQCGNLGMAERIFRQLSLPNEHSWTSIIQGYCTFGEEQCSLDTYTKMVENRISPSRHTFVAVLKACTQPEFGQALHTETVKMGFHSEMITGNALVDMCSKCGLLAEARAAFDELLEHNVISWTVLISGYVDHGLGEAALMCVEEMLLNDVSPDPIMYVLILRACGIAGAIERGRELHVEVDGKGLLRDAFVGNTLLDMYAKCGCVQEAREVFDGLPVRDAVSWSALIAAYVEQGLSEEALNCWKHMLVEGVPPVPASFVSSLKACISLGAVDLGLEIHLEIVKVGLDGDAVVGNTLLDLYANYGFFAEAKKIFDGLPAQGIVPWTMLLAAYLEHGLNEQVLICLEQLQSKRVSPDVIAFVCSLKACGKLGAIHKGYELHNEIAKKGFVEDVFVGNTLVGMYAKCGMLTEASLVFDRLLVQDVVSWNGLILGYSDHGLGEKALNYFQQMKGRGISPDAVTFASCLKACAIMGAGARASEIHSEIATKGMENDVLVTNALVDVYGKCGLFGEARKMFDELPIQDVVSWNALIVGHTEHNAMEEASSCFQQMQAVGIAPDVASWNAMILGCSEQGEKDRAFLHFAQMKEQGLAPNLIIFVSMIKICGSPATLDNITKLHAQVHTIDGGKEIFEETLATTLIDVYSKRGGMVVSRNIFNTLPVKVLATWNAMITSYARQGESALALHTFGQMRNIGILPDEVTFLGLLNACSHAGLLDRGHKFFESMTKEFGVNPNIEHVTCMIDLYGRSGQLDKAVALVEKLPFQADLVVWQAMLSACRKWGSVELASEAFRRAVKLDEWHASSYISMSNMYMQTTDDVK